VKRERKKEGVKGLIFGGFDCLDMRIRHLSKGGTTTSLVQELGRLCRYVTDEKNIHPYAILSKVLFEQLEEAQNLEEIKMEVDK
jgi:hypothetical protein